MSTHRIALHQNAGRPGEPAAQLASLAAAAGAAAGAGARIVVCPELYMTGYNIGARIRTLAEPQGGPFMAAVAGIARTSRVAIVYGYPERDGGHFYNAAAVVGADGTLAANYRKVHLIGALEYETFGRGREIVVAEVDGLRVAPMICYDVEFPEMARAAALRGAQAIVAPTALRHRYAYLARTMIPTRAFENGIYAAYANHAGAEDDWHYCGLSLVAGPDGSVVQAAGDQPELVIAEIDTDRIAAAQAELPYLRDLRPSVYGR